MAKSRWTPWRNMVGRSKVAEIPEGLDAAIRSLVTTCRSSSKGGDVYSWSNAFLSFTMVLKEQTKNHDPIELFVSHSMCGYCVEMLTAYTIKEWAGTDTLDNEMKEKFAYEIAKRLVLWGRKGITRELIYDALTSNPDKHTPDRGLLGGHRWTDLSVLEEDENKLTSAYLTLGAVIAVLTENSDGRGQAWHKIYLDKNNTFSPTEKADRVLNLLLKDFPAFAPEAVSVFADGGYTFALVSSQDREALTVFLLKSMYTSYDVEEKTLCARKKDEAIKEIESKGRQYFTDTATDIFTDTITPKDLSMAVHCLVDACRQGDMTKLLFATQLFLRGDAGAYLMRFTVLTKIEWLYDNSPEGNDNEKRANQQLATESMQRLSQWLSPETYPFSLNLFYFVISTQVEEFVKGEDDSSLPEEFENFIVFLAVCGTLIALMTESDIGRGQAWRSVYTEDNTASHVEKADHVLNLLLAQLPTENYFNI